MSEFKNYTLEQFTESLSSSAPTPGGGGAAALSASVGISLGGMVAAITAANEKYQHVWDEMNELKKHCDYLKALFLELIDADANAYFPLAKAYKLPKNTNEEIALRNEEINNASLNACITPIDIMTACTQAIDIMDVLKDKGSLMVLSDVGAGVMLLRSALKTASINVYINLGSMADKAMCEKLKQKTDDMLDEYIKKADDIYEAVLKTIS